MADYKELLRKAVEALPENNGAARRAVYEKARSALVAQLRGLNPPLPAREITQHRLQLEDCIRQVEQEASEQLVPALSRQSEDAPQLPPPPQLRARAEAAVPARADKPAPRPSEPEAIVVARGDAPVPAKADMPAPRHGRGEAPLPPPSKRVAPPPQVLARPDGQSRPPSRLSSRAKPAGGSIEDIIAAAGEEFPETAPAPVQQVEPAPRAALPLQQPAPPQIRSKRVPEPVIEVEPEPDADDESAEDIVEVSNFGRESGPPMIAAPTGLDRVEEIDPEQADEDEPAPESARRQGRRGEARPQPLLPPARRKEPQASPAKEPAKEQPKAPPRALPSIVARAEAIKSGNGRSSPGAALPAVQGKPLERQTPVVEPRREVAAASGRGQALARRALPFDSAAATAPQLGEVEVADDASDPQGAIDRAIATLDREARGEATPVNGTVVEMPGARSAPQREAVPEAMAEVIPQPMREPPQVRDAGMARGTAEEERGGSSAITIFLMIFLVLLILACGGAFWAWHEGYIDFAGMFGKPQVQTQSNNVPKPPASAVSAPGARSQIANTTSAPSPSAVPGASLKSDDRLTAPAAPAASPSQPPAQVAAPAPAPAAQPAAPAAPAATAPSAAPAEVNAPDGGEVKSEDRLSEAPANAPDSSAATVAPNAAATAGSQSLLLEASDDGTTGAVPFSGTVDWSEGKDEFGQPTLVGKANIPARNLSVNVLIRKNSDPTLPASHLMEVNFKVSDTFIGGSIAGLPGVLLKNEELVQGSPLVGASARVVGNSFLFALSSAAADVKANVDLLTSRKWIDLAIIYATGKRAIITLEKDDKAQALFSQVFDAWAKQPAASTKAASGG